jgi:twitching motility protein PilT
MADIDQYLKIAYDKEASDLHFTTGAPPTLRIHGELMPMEEEPLAPDRVREMLMQIMTDEQRIRFRRQHELDFAYMARGIARFRVTVFEQLNGMGGVFRLIPDRILSLAELNLPRTLETFTRMDKGLVLITGATGSGKTTTLASIIDIINRNYKKHIITVEDPIEFVHVSRRCLISQREVGNETLSFHNALRSVVRQDCDILLVGELRDLETVSLTLHAAESGTMIFATVHTNSAVKTVDRVIDMFPLSEQNHVRYILAATLRGVVSQQLLPLKGRRGRIPATEVMMGTPAIANVIREGKTPQLTSLIQAGRRDGMQTMDHSLIDLYKRNLISTEEVMHRLVDKKLLGRL